jgi:hypothetical protein
MICPICKNGEFRLVDFRKQRSFTGKKGYGRFVCQNTECGFTETI